MAKQTFTTGQVLTAAQMTSLQQTAMLGGAASAKTASYTLVAADAGTAISMSNASATTITVNTALFAAGDTVQITNLGAGVCTITAGTATVNTSASLALAQYESGTLNFTSTSAAIFIKGAGAAASGMTLISTYTANNTAATFTISSIAGTFKHLLLVGTALQSSSTGNLINFRLNGDTGANYTGTGFGFYAGGLQSIQPTGDVEASIYRTMARSTDTILRFGVFDMWIYDYASTSNRKNFSYRAGASNNGDLSSVSFNGFWNNSADAVTSITVYAAANFNAGIFKLYGVS